MQELQKRVDFITLSNWLILLIGGAAGLMMTPVKFATGIILGGLIVAVNFHLLKHTLKKMLQPETVLNNRKGLVGKALIKYYLRFTISGILIYLLITKHIVHPLGLLAGLSVVVASFFLATMLELKRLLFKEAV